MTDPHVQKNNNEDVNKKSVNLVTIDFSADGLILNVLLSLRSHGIDSTSVATVLFIYLLFFVWTVQPTTLVKIDEKCRSRVM